MMNYQATNRRIPDFVRQFINWACLLWLFSIDTNPKLGISEVVHCNKSVRDT